MKFNSKLPDDTINAPEYSVLREFLSLILVVAIALVVFYFTLGIAVDLVIPYIPDSMEIALGENISPELCSETERNSEMTKRMQAILNGLKEDQELTSVPVFVCVDDSSEVNAFAFMGGNIIINQGLMDIAANDDELAFVLAHELGHVRYRHHMRLMGRSLALLIVTMFLGENNNLGNSLFNESIGSINLGYSREMEKEADLYAIDIMKQNGLKYDSAFNIMRQIGEVHKNEMPLEFFSTHPAPDNRIKYMKKHLNVE